jgi:BirA family biotin operon repressor/biotin-[acetyl-CoA-carboxylase] ligase
MKMNLQDKILMILLQNQDSFISGEEISRELGVSRTAVWKVIGQLRQDDFVIQSKSNKGYRLQKIADRLNATVIRHYLRAQKLGHAMEIHNSIGSTNNRAKELAQEGAAHGTLVAAEEQQTGRGRLGRDWSSPPGVGLWMSLILRPAFPPWFAPKVTVIAGLAVLRAINSITGLKAAIKWPNDIIINSKKVCGILTEMQADLDMIEYVIAGIGVNVNTSKDSFPEEIRDSATSLYMESGKQVERCRLMAAILDELEELYQEYEKTIDFAGIIQEFKENCITLGRHVRVVSVAGEWEGKAIDLTDDCELVVELADGTRRAVMSGDVSVRGIAGYM